MNSATVKKPVRKVPAAAAEPKISPAFFTAMDEILAGQRRDRKRLQRQLAKKAA